VRSFPVKRQNSTLSATFSDRVKNWLQSFWNQSEWSYPLRPHRWPLLMKYFSAKYRTKINLLGEPRTRGYCQGGIILRDHEKMRRRRLYKKPSRRRVQWSHANKGQNTRINRMISTWDVRLLSPLDGLSPEDWCNPGFTCDLMCQLIYEDYVHRIGVLQAEPRMRGKLSLLLIRLRPNTFRQKIEESLIRMDVVDLGT
jgi:hypothetical protein